MKCPACGHPITRVVTKSTDNTIHVGDVIIPKSLVVIRQDGTLLVKCSECKTFAAIKRVPVFRVLVDGGAGKIG